MTSHLDDSSYLMQINLNHCVPIFTPPMMVCLQADADSWLSCPSSVSYFFKKIVGITTRHALIEKDKEVVHKRNEKGGIRKQVQNETLNPTVR